MNKNRLEIWVNRIVDRVLDGGTREDDLVEIKGDWPGPEQAGQLAGMANSAGGQPILWIIGLSERRHELVAFEKDRDLNTWWPAMEKQFAHGVAPQIETLYVDIERGDQHIGSVCALLFETDRAPYMINLKDEDKDKNTGWAKAAVPWRSATGTRTATRAELLSLLQAKAVVPSMAVVWSDVSLYDPAKAEAPLDKTRLSFMAIVLIDSQPGQHTFFPTHRQRITLCSSRGHEVDCSAATYVTSAPMRPPSDPNNPFETRFPRPKEFNQYGATDSPSGLVMMAPDVVRMELSAYLEPAVSQSLSESDWVELVAVLPIGASDQQAGLRQRLLRTKHHKVVPADYGGQELLTSWVTGHPPRRLSGSQQKVEVRMPSAHPSAPS
ncbi:hypothetical protein [Nocardia rhizosphaerae]|uniref:DNA-binding protein n=1 Tax=Nocardia rhizosphaerae TaxID=1691571 RepID=A0ABV8LF64_9NOCA